MKTIRLVFTSLHFPLYFILLYIPWSNGAVERLGKEMLPVFRAVLSELRMHPSEWPDILPLV